MSKKVDWKQAMLNEAEASGNERWAQEARKAVFFDFWNVSAGQFLLYLLIAFSATFFSGFAASMFTDPDLLALVCAEREGCSSGLLAAVLALIYTGAGAAFYLCGLRNIFFIVFLGSSVPAVSSSSLLPISAHWAAGLLAGVILAALPLYLGYSAAHQLKKAGR